MFGQLGHFVAVVLFTAVTGSVCLAQVPGWKAPEGAARVVTLTGQVSVLKDSQPWALQVGSVISVKQIVVTGSDGFAVFQVYDGSTFEVYPNSRVTFRNNPANWKDLLDLWLGRVKVHIEKIGGKPNNNRVTTPTAVISVRGTTFDVQVEDEDTTLVAVEEGQVAVQHALLPISEPKILNGGDYIRVYRDQPLAQKGVDKGPVVRQALRAATEALYRIVYRTPSGTGVPGGVGGPPGRSGDTDPTAGGQTPPPPPPPSGGEVPPAPPPPPPGA